MTFFISYFYVKSTYENFDEEMAKFVREYYEGQKNYVDAKIYYEQALNVAKKQNVDVTYYEQNVKRIVEYLKAN